MPKTYGCHVAQSILSFADLHFLSHYMHAITIHQRYKRTDGWTDVTLVACRAKTAKRYERESKSSTTFLLNTGPDLAGGGPGAQLTLGH